MKQRMVISLGNKVFKDNKKSVFEDFGEKIVRLSQRFEIAIVFNPETSELVLSTLLNNALKKENSVISVSARSLVDKTDPAFRTPSVFTGPEFSSVGALKVAKDKGWVMKKDGDKKYRHFVPLVQPTDILENRMISELMLNGKIVLVKNSGPVYRTKVLKLLKPAEAVVNRDFVAEKLAEKLRADYLVCLSDVSQVFLNYKTDAEVALHMLTPKEVERYLAFKKIDEKTIGKKLTACAKFAKKHKTSVICSLDNFEDALKNKSGTIII